MSEKKTIKGFALMCACGCETPVEAADFGMYAIFIERWHAAACAASAPTHSKHRPHVAEVEITVVRRDS